MPTTLTHDLVRLRFHYLLDPVPEKNLDAVPTAEQVATWRGKPWVDVRHKSWPEDNKTFLQARWAQAGGQVYLRMENVAFPDGLGWSGRTLRDILENKLLQHAPAAEVHCIAGHPIEGLFFRGLHAEDPRSVAGNWCTEHVAEAAMHFSKMNGRRVPEGSIDITAETSMSIGRRRFERDVRAICERLGVDIVVTEDRGLVRSNFTLLLRGARANEALRQIQAAYPERSL